MRGRVEWGGGAVLRAGRSGMCAVLSLSPLRSALLTSPKPKSRSMSSSSSMPASREAALPADADAGARGSTPSGPAPPPLFSVSVPTSHAVAKAAARSPVPPGEEATAAWWWWWCAWVGEAAAAAAASTGMKVAPPGERGREGEGGMRGPCEFSCRAVARAARAPGGSAGPRPSHHGLKAEPGYALTGSAWPVKAGPLAVPGAKEVAQRPGASRRMTNKRHIALAPLPISLPFPTNPSYLSQPPRPAGACPHARPG